MFLQSNRHRSIPVAIDTIEGWLQLLANATRKDGYLHADTDFKVQQIFWPALYELTAMELRQVVVSTSGKLVSDSWNPSQYAEFLSRVGPLAKDHCYFDFQTAESPTVSIGWRKAQNSVVGMAVGIESKESTPQARKAFFERMIQHTELSRLVRITDSPNGFKIEPTQENLGMHFQISTFGLNAYAWSVCGVASAQLVADIGQRLVELCGGCQASTFAMMMMPDTYEQLRSELTPLSDAWEVSYHGQIKEQTVDYLQEGGTYPGRVPLATWMREYRDDGFEPRFQVDLAKVDNQLFLEVTAQAETEKEAQAMLKKRLPKELYQQLSPIRSPSPTA